MLRNLRQRERERERERSRNKDMTQCSRCEGPWSWVLHRNQKQSPHILISRSHQNQLSPETGELLQSKKAFGETPLLQEASTEYTSSPGTDPRWFEVSQRR